MKKVIILSFLLFIAGIECSFACSAFTLKGEKNSIIGFNENWFESLKGRIVINKRGIEKTTVSWNRLEEDQASDEVRSKWVSKYGSVTFTCMGREFPIFGMNEKGLFVVELYFSPAKSPKIDGRATMFWPQWIQFIFDNYASVEEVAANIKEAPIPDWWPSFPGSHLYFSDANGDTAVIQQVKGKFRIFKGEKMPVSAVTNGYYDKDYNRLKHYKPFGGILPLKPKSSTISFQRFARIAAEVKNFNYKNDVQAEAKAWNILDNNWKGNWQLVINQNEKSFTFRSDMGPDKKSFRMDSFDFSPETPVKWLDINLDAEGDVTNQFKVWDYEENLAFVNEGLRISYAWPLYFKTEESEKFIKNLAAYPLEYK